MNQRMTLPPFGPGASFAIGAGVIATCDGAAADAAAWLCAALGAVLGVDVPHAAAMMLIKLVRTRPRLIPAKRCSISIDPSSVLLLLLHPTDAARDPRVATRGGGVVRQRMALPALEARAMSSVARTTWRATRPLRSRLPVRRWTISRPISSTG